MRLGGIFFGDGVMHESARDVDLAHGAVRPVDHLRREHGANAELLADGDEDRVDAGGIGRRELGDVADPHHHLGVGPAPSRLGVALERGHEAEADGLDDRIDEKRNFQFRQQLERRHDRVERRAEVGERDDAHVAPRELVRDGEIASS